MLREPRKMSALHDGAVFIRHGRVVQASCHLPLSTNPDVPQNFGTRHRAALGLAEKSDAVVVVVSEERGEMSLVHHGIMIRDLDLNSLRQQLLELLGLRKYDTHTEKEKLGG